MPSHYQYLVGERLAEYARRYRQATGIVSLADYVGTSHSRIYQWIRDRRIPKTKKAWLVQRWLRRKRAHIHTKENLKRRVPKLAVPRNPRGMDTGDPADSPRG